MGIALIILGVGLVLFVLACFLVNTLSEVEANLLKYDFQSITGSVTSNKFLI